MGCAEILTMFVPPIQHRLAGHQRQILYRSPLFSCSEDHNPEIGRCRYNKLIKRTQLIQTASIRKPLAALQPKRRHHNQFSISILYKSGATSDNKTPGNSASSCLCKYLALFLGRRGGFVPFAARKSSSISSFERAIEKFRLPSISFISNPSCFVTKFNGLLAFSFSSGE